MRLKMFLIGVVVVDAVAVLVIVAAIEILGKGIHLLRLVNFLANGVHL